MKDNHSIIPLVKWEIISFMDIYSEQELDAIRIRSTLILDLISAATSLSMQKKLVRETGLVGISKRDGSSRERCQCLWLRGRKEPPSWKS